MSDRGSPQQTEETYGLLCFGNELLSGKVIDENLAFWITELSKLGRQINVAMIVPDHRHAMIDALKYARERCTTIFTSGGIGPTHDDLTLPIVAEALGRKIVRNEHLENAIRDHYQDQTNDFLLRMADVPAGTELLFADKLFVPLFHVDKIYLFPGVPSLMKKKFALLVSQWRATPLYVVKFYTTFSEGEIAAELYDLESAFAGLAIGSYPRYDSEADYSVMVTLESRDRQALEQACLRLCNERFAAGLLRRQNNFAQFDASLLDDVQ